MLNFVVMCTHIISVNDPSQDNQNFTDSSVLSNTFTCYNYIGHQQGFYSITQYAGIGFMLYSYCSFCEH